MAACTIKGEIIIIKKVELTWKHEVFHYENDSFNSLVWVKQKFGGDDNYWVFCTGGCMKNITLWKYHEVEGKDNVEVLFKMEDAHKSWIRNLSWGFSGANEFSYLASAGEDGYCILWRIHNDKRNDVLEEL